MHMKGIFESKGIFVRILLIKGERIPTASPQTGETVRPEMSTGMCMGRKVCPETAPKAWKIMGKSTPSAVKIPQWTAEYKYLLFFIRTSEKLSVDILSFTSSVYDKSVCFSSINVLKKGKDE